MQGNTLIFTEEDHRAVVDISTALLRCRTRAELTACLEGHILKLLAASACGYTCAGLDRHAEKFGVGGVVDAAGDAGDGTSTFPLEAMAKCLPYLRSFSEKFAHSARTVIANDVDIPRATLRAENEAFFADHPHFGSLPAFERSQTLMLMYDPDLAVMFGIWRYPPVDQPWTLRDIRVMELVRPALLFAIKNVSLTGRLNASSCQSIFTLLGDIPSPVAVVNPELSVIYRNKPFAAMLPWTVGETLSGPAADFIKGEIDKLTKLGRSRSVKAKTAMPRRFAKMFSRLTLNRIDCNACAPGDGCYLLRLRANDDFGSKLDAHLDASRISPREAEIVRLLRDGFDNREISARLFISVHTVKNHLKNIYRKLKVDGREKLLARLISMSQIG